MAWLALLPVGTTGLFYALPARLQVEPLVIFLPQALAYLGFAVWALTNGTTEQRLGLEVVRIPKGLAWGSPIGFVLGGLNVAVILWLIPWLGGDIQFLRDTPHARAPVAAMLPWGILLIAIAIELNFRGFLLGRLLALWSDGGMPGGSAVGCAVAVLGSALVFSFDPFMVTTFKHLHWIALWDGIIWGLAWIRVRNLYVPITAHAVEVMVMYSVLKLVLA
jgi:membrane protease YdiL (CAAX protease family)